MNTIISHNNNKNKSQLYNIIKDYNQFVFWVYTYEGDKKPKKVPISWRTLQKIDSMKGYNWASLDFLIEKYLKVEADGSRKVEADGLNFALIETDPFLVIDLDNCVDEDGNLNEFAQYIVEKFNSYVEYSPSKTGIHIWCTTTEPVSSRNKRNIIWNEEVYSLEIYYQKHTMSVTLDVCKNLPLVDATEIIKDVIEEFGLHDRDLTIPSFNYKELTEVPEKDRYDLTIWEKIHNHKKPEIRELFNLSAVTSNDDASSLDFKRCYRLVWETQGELNRVKRLMMQSGFFRDKWIEARTTGTWLEECINKAYAYFLESKIKFAESKSEQKLQQTVIKTFQFGNSTKQLGK